MQTSLVESRYLRLLLRWGSASVLAGSFALFWAWGQETSWAKFTGVVAMHAIIWGGIDALLAWRGLKKHHALAQLDDAHAQQTHMAGVVASLRFNEKLDWLYVAVGNALAIWALAAAGDARASLAGHAAGMLSQGGFLLLFDLAYLQALQRAQQHEPASSPAT